MPDQPPVISAPRAARCRSASVLAVLACLIAAAPGHAQESGNTAMIAQECIACHATPAVGRRIPPLWGLDPNQFVAAMEEYRAGTRDNPTMVTVARGLSSQLIVELARYFSQPAAAGN